MNRISVIIPIHNEEKSLGELYQRLVTVLVGVGVPYEIIFVNDGSSDHSLSIINTIAEQDQSVFFISFSRNFGHQIAVSAGLDSCTGDAVVIMDGDLQDPPELISELYEKYLEGYEVVYAQRSKREGEGFFKKITAKLFYRTLRAMTEIDIPVDTGDFRLIDKKVVEYLRQMPEQNKFLRGQIAWLGFRQTAVYFERAQRKYGTTSYSIGKMFRFAMDGITSFSNHPLRLVTGLGFFISFLSLVIILYALYSHYILDRTITGWTSLIISSMFIGGVQLISIGIIGTYIARINRNTLQRPLYIIQDSKLPVSKQADDTQQ